jgi:polyphosphate glucokinase
VVRHGRVLTAPNLDNKGWKGYDLAGALGRALGKPVRVANDADVQGLAVIAGKGVEMVVTLGTGFGTGLYLEGRLAPHLELSHHVFRKGETYDEQLGNAARKRVGNRKWNRRVRKAVRVLRALTNFDHLYIGGGNAKKIDFELDPDVTVVSNDAGLKGGIALWHD